MIVGLIRSIIRMSRQIIASSSAWRTAVIFARNIPLSTMAVARAVLAFLWLTKRAVTPSVSNDERLYEKALLNGESPTARNRVRFVHGDAALYELPAQADRCFFFNPFALHTIKRVLGNIFDSLYHHPREIKLFFYYVNEEVENFLNNHVRLEQEEPIDCSDLFEEKDAKERILVYSVNLF